jgi:hypothetical protein
MLWGILKKNLVNRPQAPRQSYEQFAAAATSLSKASFISVNWGEKHCIRIPVAFRLYLVKIIQILTN